jgi:taurine dioxygenase
MNSNHIEQKKLSVDTNELNIEVLVPAIGAIIHDIDLSDVLDKSNIIQQIEQAFIKHRVIFFRNQRLTPKQHRDFARLFGDLHSNPFYSHVPDIPELTVIEFGPGKKPNNDGWHSDITFTEKPALGCILYAREIPSSGGDTLWSSMYSAYDALSLPMKNFLSTLSAEHSYAKNFNLTNVHLPDVKEKLDKAKKELPPVVHPVIRTHPVTKRKVLFVNTTFTTRIVGLNDNESDVLLNYLFSLVNKPEHTIRWHWKENDVAFWDNRSTQHYPVGDYWPNRRRMERATIIGDIPV